MEKVTKMDNFKEIYKILTEGNHTELAKVMEHEMELLTKKNSKRSDKPTKAQAENAVLAEDVLKHMEAGTAYTVSEIQKMVPALAELSNQRATAVVRSLVRIGRLQRTEEKGKAYFTLV